MKRAMLSAGLAAIMAGLMPLPAQAQTTEARLERIETQLRAVQRQVFPGGDQRFFEPEITAQQQTLERDVPGVTGSALTDVLTRLEAIEAQLARLTATTEVNENAMRGIEMRLAALEAGTGAATSGMGSTPAPTSSMTSPQGPTGVIPVPAAQPVSQPAAANVVRQELPPVAGGPSPERLAAVQAIAKPSTADAGQDDYVYGFRLWEAGFFPEAQQQLALFIERHPRHASVSRGRNLLGRAFLDAGEPRTAATHFFDNYRANPQGERAADSLLYLAESMLSLNDTDRTCRALAEFSEVYPALAVGRLQGQYNGLFSRVDCN